MCYDNSLLDLMRTPMSLIEDLKQDITNARYAKDGATIAILSTLLGDASAIGKKKLRDSTDEEVVSVVKKFIEGINENLKLSPTSEQVSKWNFEKDLLSKYMPQQMTKEELQAAINEIILDKGMTSIRELGVVMGELKKHFAGKYDGGLAKTLVSESLVR